MSNDNDLFAQYPNHPGWKSQATSAEAAAAVADTAPIWRAKCLAAIEASPDGLTANEAAALLDHDICSIRPRLTELARMEKIHNSGTRRPTPSGCSAIVWRAGAAPAVAAAA